MLQLSLTVMQQLVFFWALGGPDPNVLGNVVVGSSGRSVYAGCADHWFWALCGVMYCPHVLGGIVMLSMDFWALGCPQSWRFGIMYLGTGCKLNAVTSHFGRSGLVVCSETQVFAAMVLVTLHFLSAEATDDIEDAELFAQKHNPEGLRHTN